MWFVWMLGVASVLAIIVFAAVMYPAASVYLQDTTRCPLGNNEVVSAHSSLLPLWRPSSPLHYNHTLDESFDNATRDHASVRTRALGSTEVNDEQRTYGRAQQQLQMYM